MNTKGLKRAIKKILALCKALYGLARAPFCKKEYAIKRGYFHRRKYLYFNDTQLKDEYQREVYEIAKQLAIQNNLKTIIDFGCGSAFKLMKYFSDFDTIGIDISPTYEFLVQKYPQRTWVNGKEIEEINLSGDLVICSDVIEHVLNPDDLLNNIKRINGFKYVLISTPERNIKRGYFDYGPPPNRSHIREWNGVEFGEYLSRHFDIISHQVSNFSQATQLEICRNESAN